MRKIYSLLGLCKKAGKLAGGEAAAEQAVRDGSARLLIVAEDASANTKKKFHNSAAYYHIPIVEAGEKTQLGRAIGQEIRAVLAVTEEGFAKKLEALCAEERKERMEHMED